MKTEEELIWESYITESPTFNIDTKSIKDESGRQLKQLTLKDVIDNIVVFYSEKETFFTPPGFFLVYFTIDEQTAKEIGDNKRRYPIIPRGRSQFGGGMTPFEKVWRKPESEGILGMIQGEIDDDVIWIEFMTVRSKARKQSITSKMIDKLKEEFPNRNLESSDRTKAGEAFWKKYNK
jgi:hypothetical protein